MTRINDDSFYLSGSFLLAENGTIYANQHNK